jgi:hypothetical protein
MVREALPTKESDDCRAFMSVSFVGQSQAQGTCTLHWLHRPRWLVPTPSAAISTALAAATIAFLGASLVDRYAPALDLLSVQSGDGRSRFLVAVHLNETEAFGLLGGAIRDDFGGAHSAMRREELFQLTVANAIGQVADV